MPFTSQECELNEKNYQTSDNAIITYTSASGKEIQISEDSELSIQSEKSIGNNDGVSSANNIGNQKPIDNTDFKDAVLAALYSQVEFLRNQLEEKDLLIRTLITRDGEELVQAVLSHNNIPRDAVITSSSTSSSSGSGNEDSMFECFGNVNNEVLNNNVEVLNSSIAVNEPIPDEVNFEELYMQFVRDTEEERIKSGNLLWKLQGTRKMKHCEFCHTRNLVEAENLVQNREEAYRYGDEYANDDEDILPAEKEKADNQFNEKVPWKKGTVLIMGDSTLNGIQETLMGPCFKVRAFPGTIVGDFHHHAIPLLEKKPSYIVIMAGTNDAITRTSEVILVELLQLKSVIEYALPGCKVVISCPTDRFDDHKAWFTVLHFRRKLNNLQIPLISNDNIRDVDIGKKGFT